MIANLDPEGRDLTEDSDAGEAPPPNATAPGQTTMQDVVACPWCGEANDLFLEPSSQTDEHVFDEECQACGKSFKVTAEHDPSGAARLHVVRDE